VSEMTEVCGSI